MSYIGNTPAESFISFEKQVFTIVNSQTAYTLSHSVVNENDIRLVINNVVQEPGSGKAYTASGTTLTLSAALVNGTDEMYCVFLGRALQTVNPPNASVGTSQLAATSVTAAKLNNDIISGTTALGATPADTDELLISDAGTLKRVDYSYLKSANTPAFAAYANATQTGVSNTTWTKVTLGTEAYDTASAFASDKFTVPSGQGGKYIFSYSINIAGNTNYLKQGMTVIYKNGSTLDNAYRVELNQKSGVYNMNNFVVGKTAEVALSAGDYIELYGYCDVYDGNNNFYNGYLSGHKIIE